jgi:AcrR family transcriptional regulator
MIVAVERETRDVLLDAAEALFAAEGIDGVSLADITRLAGQRNGGAIHYYFGGRDGLLTAILDRHQAVLDSVRMDALIDLRRTGSMSLSALVRVIVEPLAARLDSVSGRSFLEIQRQRLVEPVRSGEHRTASVRLIAAEIEALLAVRFDQDEQVERDRLVRQLVIGRLADLGREEALGIAAPRALVVETLVSAATSIMGGELAV